jgi:hypothetical protein
MTDLDSESAYARTTPWGEPEAIAIVAIDNEATCQHCRNPFKPRNSTGGRTQKYCSPECRKSANNSRRSQRLTETPTPQTETPQRLTDVSPTPHETLAPKAVPAPPAPKPEPEFDWNDDEAPIVLAEQAETAVYRSPTGHLVIRQKNWPDEDIVVLIAPQYVMDFVDRLTDVAGIPSLGRGA